FFEELQVLRALFAFVDFLRLALARCAKRHELIAILRLILPIAAIECFKPAQRCGALGAPLCVPASQVRTVGWAASGWRGSRYRSLDFAGEVPHFDGLAELTGGVKVREWLLDGGD